MSWFSQKLHELQNKPYEEKLRILRRTVIVTAILLLGFWALSLRYRQIQSSGFGNVFSPLQEGFKQLKNSFPQKSN
jgi:hypothetical protein